MCVYISTFQHSIIIQNPSIKLPHVVRFKPSIVGIVAWMFMTNSGWNIMWYQGQMLLSPCCHPAQWSFHGTVLNNGLKEIGGQRPRRPMWTRRFWCLSPTAISAAGMMVKWWFLMDKHWLMRICTDPSQVSCLDFALSFRLHCFQACSRNLQYKAPKAGTGHVGAACKSQFSKLQLRLEHIFLCVNWLKTQDY